MNGTVSGFLSSISLYGNKCLISTNAKKYSIWRNRCVPYGIIKYK